LKKTIANPKEITTAISRPDTLLIKTKINGGNKASRVLPEITE